MDNRLRFKRKNSNQSPRKLYRLIYSLMFLSVAGIAVFSVLLYRNKQEYRQGDAIYNSIRTAARNGNDTVDMDADAEDKVNRSDETTSSSGRETAGSGHLTGDAQDVSEAVKTSQIDFSSLEAINEDVVGWIQADGRGIDYPIVLGEDNEYYLTHLFNHEENRIGSIFMDYRNNSDFLDKSSVIYGHYLKDGAMFSSILKYKKQSHYDTYPAMTLYTPEGDYTIELFAGIVHDGNYEFVQFEFNDSGDFLDYIGQLKAQSTFKSEVMVDADDRIITLSTCSYEFDNARYALYGKLVSMP